MSTRRARLWRALGWGPLLLVLLCFVPWTFSGSSMAPASTPLGSPAPRPGAAAAVRPSPAPTPTSGLAAMVSTVEAQSPAVGVFPRRPGRTTSCQPTRRRSAAGQPLNSPSTGRWNITAKS